MTSDQALNELLPLQALRESKYYPALLKFLKTNEDQIINEMARVNSEKVMQLSGKLLVVRETVNYFENQLEMIINQIRQEINETGDVNNG